MFGLLLSPAFWTSLAIIFLVVVIFVDFFKDGKKDNQDKSREKFKDATESTSAEAREEEIEKSHIIEEKTLHQQNLVTTEASVRKRENTSTKELNEKENSQLLTQENSPKPENLGLDKETTIEEIQQLPSECFSTGSQRKLGLSENVTVTSCRDERGRKSQTYSASKLPPSQHKKLDNLPPETLAEKLTHNSTHKIVNVENRSENSSFIVPEVDFKNNFLLPEQNEFASLDKQTGDFQLGELVLDGGFGDFTNSLVEQSIVEGIVEASNISVKSKSATEKFAENLVRSVTVSALEHMQVTSTKLFPNTYASSKYHGPPSQMKCDVKDLEEFAIKLSNDIVDSGLDKAIKVNKLCVDEKNDNTHQNTCTFLNLSNLVESVVENGIKKAVSAIRVSGGECQEMGDRELISKTHGNVKLAKKEEKHSQSLDTMQCSGGVPCMSKQEMDIQTFSSNLVNDCLSEVHMEIFGVEPAIKTDLINVIQPFADKMSENVLILALCEANMALRREGNATSLILHQLDSTQIEIYAGNIVQNLICVAVKQAVNRTTASKPPQGSKIPGLQKSLETHVAGLIDLVVSSATCEAAKMNVNILDKTDEQLKHNLDAIIASTIRDISHIQGSTGDFHTHEELFDQRVLNANINIIIKAAVCHGFQQAAKTFYLRPNLEEELEIKTLIEPRISAVVTMLVTCAVNEAIEYLGDSGDYHLDDIEASAFTSVMHNLEVFTKDLVRSSSNEAKAMLMDASSTQKDFEELNVLYVDPSIRQMSQSLLQSSIEEILDKMDGENSVSSACTLNDSESQELEISTLTDSLITFSIYESIKCIRQCTQGDCVDFAGNLVDSVIQSAINDIVERSVSESSFEEPVSPVNDTPPKLVLSKQSGKIQSKWLTEEELCDLDFYDSELDSPENAPSPTNIWKRTLEEKANDGGQTGYQHDLSPKLKISRLETGDGKLEETRSEQCESQKNWKISTEELRKIADNLDSDSSETGSDDEGDGIDVLDGDDNQQEGDDDRVEGDNDGLEDDDGEFEEDDDGEFEEDDDGEFEEDELDSDDELDKVEDGFVRVNGNEVGENAENNQGIGNSCHRSTILRSVSSKFNTPVILDSGCGSCKVGFANDTLPTIVAPSVIGTVQGFSHEVNCYKGKLFGENALDKAAVARIDYPIKSGVIDNWRDIENLWDYLLHSELNITPAEHPILVTELAANNKKNREKIAEVLFENCRVPAMYIANQPVLSLYSMGMTSGLSLSSSFAVTQASIVYDGNVIDYSIQQLDIGGQQVTNRLKQLLGFSEGFNFNSSSGWKIVNSIKEKMAFISQDFDSEMKSSNTSCYKLPDGQVIDVGNEKFNCGEILFKPEMCGRQTQLPVHLLIEQSLKCCDSELADVSIKNAVISGGNTLIPGFKTRLETEVTKLVPKLKQFNTPENNLMSTWIGGSVFASLPTFEEQCVTVDEYAESGGSIVHRKCF